MEVHFPDGFKGFFYLKNMAKELPYFQFEPSEWQNGDIQMASNEAKIAFIEILCSYWQRLGSLPYAFALQRHCNGKENALRELIDCNAIKEIEGQIVISFLDSQLKGLESKSQKARESANKRWNKGENANAIRTHTKRNANRIEENRIEEIKESKEAVFKKNLLTFKENYTLELLEKFFLYWTEKNPNGKKMKFEMQKTFDIERRLLTWSKNEKNFNGNSNGKMTTEERQAANRRIFQKVMEGTK